MGTLLKDTQQKLAEFIKKRVTKKDRVPDPIRESIVELSKEFSFDELKERLPISKTLIYRIIRQHEKEVVPSKKIKASSTIQPAIRPVEFISVPLKDIESTSERKCRMEIELEGCIKVRIY